LYKWHNYGIDTKHFEITSRALEIMLKCQTGGGVTEMVAQVRSFDRGLTVARSSIIHVLTEAGNLLDV